MNPAPTDAGPCRLGYEEHDGDAYCFAHFGFAPVAAGIRVCDRRPRAAPPTHPTDEGST